MPKHINVVHTVTVRPYINELRQARSVLADRFVSSSQAQPSAIVDAQLGSHVGVPTDVVDGIGPVESVKIDPIWA